MDGMRMESKEFKRKIKLQEIIILEYPSYFHYNLAETLGIITLVIG